MTALQGPPAAASRPEAPVGEWTAGFGGARADRAVLVEQRDFLLRSLRDLESERAAGDIDEVDYASLKDDYTARAAAVLRQLQVPNSPAPPSPPPPDGSGGSRRRRARKPASIALAALAAVGAVAWALDASSASRSPGGPISGQAVGSEVTAQLLTQARQATARGDAVGALKDYQRILGRQPDQVEALTEKGWLLAETQQPALVRQGLDSLAQAERVDPSFAPAHLYRGTVLLSEGDNTGAIPELRYYLAHQPDPQLVPRVRQALGRAEATVTAGR